MRRAAWLRGAAAALLGAAAAAFAGTGVAANEGAPDREGWVAEGGSPARTAAAEERPLEGPVEVAWQQKVGGEVASEPVVHAGLVAIDSDQRFQHTLSLHQFSDGRPVTSRVFKTAAPLLPCTARGVLCVRTGPTVITGFRWQPPQLTTAFTLDAGAPVESFVAVDREVYVRTPTAVKRYDFGARSAAWTVPGTVRGRLAVRGPHVYFLTYGEDGVASLDAVSRASGALEARIGVGHHGGRVPSGPAEEASIAVLADRVLVRHGLEVPTKTKIPARVYSVQRDITATGVLGLSEPKLFASTDAPLGLPDGWLLSVKDEEGPYLLHTSARRGGVVLGTRGDHPEWLDGWTLASAAPGVVYHPAGVLSVRTQRIVWTFQSRPVRRPVPVQGLVIAAEAGGGLRAYRRKSAPGATDIRTAGEGFGTAPRDARIVLHDGTVVAGRCMRAAGGFTVEGTPPRTIAAADVALVEDASGALLEASRAPDELRLAIDALAQPAQAEGAAAVLREAFASRDPDLLRSVATSAALVGAPRTELDRIEVRLREVEKPGGKPMKFEPETTAKLLARLETIARLPATYAMERYSKLPADAPPDLRIDLIRVALRTDPNDAGAVTAVRSLLPAHLSPPDPFDAADWLDFADVTRNLKLTIHGVPDPKKPKLSPAERIVGIHSASFRSDIVGFESERILVVTPLQRPGAIARCLATGELACKALETMFAGCPPRRETGQPLTIVLCSDQEEFRKEAAKRGFTEADDAYWWPGMYLSSEETAWVFLPDDDANFERVISPFVHDVTFAWLDTRCPAFKLSERRGGGNVPGMFAASGLATAVGELRLDLRRGTWELDPAAESADVVAKAPGGKLHAWQRVLDMSSAAYDKLGEDDSIAIPGTRRLGVSYSARRIWFRQSTAICSYLIFAEDGKLRPKLADVVAAHYRGEKPDWAALLGMSADELGQRVTAWSKSLQSK